MRVSAQARYMKNTTHKSLPGFLFPAHGHQVKVHFHTVMVHQTAVNALGPHTGRFPVLRYWWDPNILLEA